ncbi:TVP38/TMEM64 family protein [Streptomyces spiroverticillatus]|uniref:TVP38/TMEM64 family membrane protein n=1 Tax=Streptomyces finlayi TaxID=67296 RepID=A0A918X3Q4_9ACTN|nr:TVP38/TMEM64 family protein [Streptomyces finlayi]GHA28515.1 TVP38/TMEM64 family protein [Streptomyces spiroverticillatus]GHD09198.1 TVP38/TMEM64 family protein [Streptomyces finlayi]
MFDHATGATPRTDAPLTDHPCTGRSDAAGPRAGRPDGARADAPRVVRFARVLLSPWARLALLLVVLASAATAVLLYEPQKMLADGWPPQLGGAMAAVLFGVAYGLCTVAFVPRPILNLAAGALFGTALGLTTSIGGTVLGAGISFALGRYLGQDALRPMLRGRVLLAADGVLSRHGFRSMLAIRLFPGVPFAAANYCAAVSRMRYLSFLTATGLGSIPNTLAYVIAGSEASSPTSPAFVISTAFIVVTSIAGVVVAWCKRHSIGRSAGPTSPVAASEAKTEETSETEEAAKTPALPLSNK